MWRLAPRRAVPCVSGKAGQRACTSHPQALPGHPLALPCPPPPTHPLRSLALPSLLQSAGYFYDPVLREVEGAFMPWLKEQAVTYLSQGVVARQVRGGVGWGCLGGGGGLRTHVWGSAHSRAVAAAAGRQQGLCALQGGYAKLRCAAVP